LHGSSPTSRFLLHLFAAFAELERAMIRERLVSAVRNPKMNGKSWGRPKRVFRPDEAVAMRANGKSGVR
jgi:DNA invertase Pin-like site-specific DNA recombinase